MLKAGWSISLSKIKNVKIKNQNDNAKCKILDLIIFNF